METRTYNVYKFEELPKETQERVIEKWYEKEDYPFLTEDLKEELNQLDFLKLFSNIELQYSLSCCQGDGLSFSANIDLEAWLKYKKVNKKKIKTILENVYKIQSKGNTGRYCYASESDIEWEEQNDLPIGLYTEIEAIRGEISDYYIDICKKLEKAGYNIINYRMNKKEFNEMAEGNNCMFTENGEID